MDFGCIGGTREYLMIYRGSGGCMIWLLAPLPQSTVSKLDGRHTEKLRKRDKFPTGKGGGDGRGAESYDHKKAWALSKSFNTLWGGTFSNKCKSRSTASNILKFNQRKVKVASLCRFRHSHNEKCMYYVHLPPPPMHSPAYISWQSQSQPWWFMVFTSVAL